MRKLFRQMFFGESVSLQPLIDESPKTGVFQGDLAYGRCRESELVKHKDFPARTKDGDSFNQPVAKLTLVEKRDPTVWEKSEKDKKIMKKVARSVAPVESQFQLKVLESYARNSKWMRANIHIKIDGSRL